MNPYIQAGQPATLKPSVFCFLDVLGYSEFARQPPSPELSDRFGRYHEALSKGAEILKATDRQQWIAPMRGSHDAAVTAFTDCIAIGIPIYFRDGEVEVGEALQRIGGYQLEMANRGYFVRGAMSFGDVYVDDLAVFGAPLIEAYEGETQRAVNPRIVVCQSARDLATQHLGYYGNQAHAPLNSELKCDQDGEWFVDYLDSLLVAPDEGVFGAQELVRHKEVVEEKLALHADSGARILGKYEWVARYHNWFCHRHRYYYGAEPMIEGYEPAQGVTEIVEGLERR